ncbi:T9SS sorting signal type C domain-containing protein, partial [Flavobacterium sp.]|uniref:T9SS sorting signal type C domain-containing protein n=1 Tax=Flavobacterium sp. TaxID=239 RepID=UPI00286E1079
ASSGGTGTLTYSGDATASLTAGTYNYTVTDANGCTATASATINAAPAQLTTNDTQTSCDSYTWPVSGLNYTSTGIYTFNTVNGSGCTVINTLNLTITPSTTNNNVTQAQLGGSYLWATPLGNGILYTVSGVYTYVDGCNTATLNLTIDSATTWNGSSWSYGPPTASVDAIIAGNFNSPADGVIIAKKLTVNSGVLTVNSGNLTIVNELINNAGATAVVFENNANLIQTGTATNTGAITVKRNSSALKLLDYTLWSSPVASQNLLNFSPTTLLNRFYTYNTGTNLYNAVPSPSTTNFAIGTGYLIRMPSLASASIPTAYPGVFTGVPNNGSIAVTLVNNGVGMRFNAVGNPYPSPISMAQFISDNSTKITSTLYFWRKTNGTLGGSYCTVNNGTFVSNGQAQVFNPNGIIQTGQGFIVEAKNASTSLTFNNGQRATNTTGQFFKTKQVVENNRIWLNATNDKGEFAQMAINYTSGANQGVDEFDAKYFNDAKTALNSVLDNTDYAIQGRALPFDGTDVVPLSFKATTADTYSIAIDHVDGLFALGKEIYLVDKTTGVETNLSTKLYTFVAAAGTDNTRFSLKFQKTLKVDAPVFDENSVVISRSNGMLNVNSKTMAISDIKVYDIQGRLIAERNNVKSNTASINNLKTVNEVIIVKVTLEDSNIATKKVLN